MSGGNGGAALICVEMWLYGSCRVLGWYCGVCWPTVCGGGGGGGFDGGGNGGCCVPSGAVAGCVVVLCVGCAGCVTSGCVFALSLFCGVGVVCECCVCGMFWLDGGVACWLSACVCAACVSAVVG